MRIQIEPTGCVEHKGLMQIRFSFFLEPNEYGYFIHHMKDGADNPFHNHFIYTSQLISDNDLMDLGEKWGRIAYDKWIQGQSMRMGDVPEFPDQTKVMARHRRNINTRLEQIKADCEKGSKYVRRVEVS